MVVVVVVVVVARGLLSLMELPSAGVSDVF
jgi:hypothetical protein